MRALCTIGLGAILAFVINSAPVQAQSPIVYVSAGGSDSNNCVLSLSKGPEGRGRERVLALYDLRSPAYSASRFDDPRLLRGKLRECVGAEGA